MGCTQDLRRLEELVGLEDANVGLAADIGIGDLHKVAVIGLRLQFRLDYNLIEVWSRIKIRSRLMPINRVTPMDALMNRLTA